MLVGASTGALTRVICDADTGSASAVRGRGGDRDVFHAVMEEIVINAKDILAWRGVSVSDVGNCVWFA